MIAQPFVARLQEAMADLKISQTDVAVRSGVSAPTVSRYLSGERPNPRAAELAAIAKALGVTLSWLFEGVGPKHPPTSGEPELASFEWPTDTPEAVRIAVQQQLLAEREAHRVALIPYWTGRMKVLLAAEIRRRS